MEEKKDSVKRTTDFYAEFAAEIVELVSARKNGVSVSVLRTALLLAAIDGECDVNEVRKFTRLAMSCGGLSAEEISGVIERTRPSVSSIEDAVGAGLPEDEIVARFMTEASGIGIEPDRGNFALWMSVAMVDGDFSDVERKAFKALQDYVNQGGEQPISDSFLRRCELILSGIYRADARSSVQLMQNRMKSLELLVADAESEEDLLVLERMAAWEGPLSRFLHAVVKLQNVDVDGLPLPDGSRVSWDELDRMQNEFRELKARGGLPSVGVSGHPERLWLAMEELSVRTESAVDDLEADLRRFGRDYSKFPPEASARVGQALALAVELRSRLQLVDVMF